MTPAKQKEQTGLNENNLIQKICPGSGVSPGTKTGAPAELCKEGRQQYTKICATENECVQN